MQAVVLAGGRGTRLRPLTYSVPKVMVPVGGRPFLSYLLGHLKACGLTDVVLCIGYLGEQIQDCFGDGAALGMNLSYSREGEHLLGTAGALKLAEPMLEEWFLVLNGDTYLPIDYRHVTSAFVTGHWPAMMVVYDNKEATGVAANVALDDKLRAVVRYAKGRADPAIRFVDAGVSILRRTVLDGLAPGQVASLEQSVFPHLAEAGHLGAHLSTSPFYDIGTFEKLRLFEGVLKQGAGR
ncbi:MAG: NTP transferase domain-containing protein [Chloroflexi bacterium]|nr:NTP transferase domain-containing protein [Chloroflexota bacterium]